jgi:hypothetical protein
MDITITRITGTTDTIAVDGTIASQDGMAGTTVLGGATDQTDILQIIVQGTIAKPIQDRKPYRKDRQISKISIQL